MKIGSFCVNFPFDHCNQIIESETKSQIPFSGTNGAENYTLRPCSSHFKFRLVLSKQKLMKCQPGIPSSGKMTPDRLWKRMDLGVALGPGLSLH